jgi:hypothetical protein
MKVLRDLFWELYSSSPEKYRNPYSGDKNNLSVIIKLVRMGLTRQITRGLKFFAEDDDAMHDFFRYFAQASMMRAENGQYLLTPVFDSLLSKDRDQKLLKNVLDQVFLAIENGKAASLKQLAFYGVNQAGQFNLIEPVLRMLPPILDRHYEYLAEHTDRLKVLLESEWVSDLIYKLYRDEEWDRKEVLARITQDAVSDPQRGVDLVEIFRAIDSDPLAVEGWDEFIRRADILLDDPGFKELKLKELVDDVLDFVEEKPGSDSAQTAPRIRAWLAARMRSDRGMYPSDLEEFILLARQNPDEFYQVLQALSRHIDNGNLKDFLRFTKRALDQKDLD